MKKFIAHNFQRLGSTLFFLGYFPFAPGTIGSLVVVSLLFYYRERVAHFFTPQYVVAFWLSYVAFVTICFLFTRNLKEIFRSEDPKQVIIDECAGQLITFFLIPLSWRVLLLGFILFRFYDIVKPFPVHVFEDIEGGVGIMMDDVIAGVMANISLFIILWSYHAVKAYL